MKKVKITVMKMASYLDLMEIYENLIEHACDMQVGKVFVSEDATCPKDFCSEAWQSIRAFVLALASGGGDFYDGWMKNKKSAMLSCNDGFRPVSFYLEVIE